MLDRLLNLDRRWIFAAMAVGVGVPVLIGLKFPEKPSTMTRTVFETVDSLPPGSRVLVAMDYDPAAKGELHPMAAAFTRHAMLRGHKLYYMTVWPAGPAFLSDMGRLIEIEFPEMQYSRDYVNLGYRAGEMGVIKLVTNDLRAAYATDVRRRSLDDLPITAGVKSVRQMDLIITVSGGTPGAKEWIQFASSPYDITTVAGTTGVQTGEVMPYFPDQLAGVLGGVKAAAEYEMLLVENYPQLAEPGRRTAPPGLFSGTVRMGPQMIAHLLMIALIVAGNVLYFAGASAGRGSMTREAFWSVLLLVGGGLALALVQLARAERVGAQYVEAVRVQPAEGDGWTVFRRAAETDRELPAVSLSWPRTVGIWIAALLTLAVFSFLAGDNPAYKLTEAIFVGVSAGYAMVAGFWDQIVQNLVARLLPGLSQRTGIANLEGKIEDPELIYLVPLVLSAMMLWQLSPKGGWIARWPLAFFIGATAGVRITATFEADFLRQIQQTLLPLVAVAYDNAASGRTVDWVSTVQGSVRNTLIVFGVLTSLTYFFFSVEHRGVVRVASRIGVYVLMITFGAGFAYTVMGRIVLLTQRLEFLFFDWLRFTPPG